MPSSSFSENKTEGNSKPQLLQKPNKIIMGFGSPLLDISADIDSQFLNKYNLVKGHMVRVNKDQMQIYQDFMQRFKVQYIAGGSSLNSIRVCQWCLKETSPNCTFFIGAVGNDKAGNILENWIKKDGVTPYLMKIDSDKTGICGVGILDKERTMFTHLGASDLYDPSHLELLHIKKAIQSSDIIYISAFFITVLPKNIYRIGQMARERDKLFCINISAQFLIDSHCEPLNEAIRYSQIIFMNELEARKYAQVCFGDLKRNMEISEIAKRFKSLPRVDLGFERTIVITRGSNSTVVCCPSIETVKETRTFEVPVQHIDSDAIVDLNGAGDAFVGGFLAEYSREGSIRKCVEEGHKAARFIIQRSGVNLDK